VFRAEDVERRQQRRASKNEVSKSVADNRTDSTLTGSLSCSRSAKYENTKKIRTLHLKISEGFEREIKSNFVLRSLLDEVGFKFNLDYSTSFIA
jgi:hypothetical protein